MAEDMLGIEDLEAAVPSMLRWRAPSARRVNWQTVERELGTPLPSDYRELGEAYPTLIVDDFLLVTLPKPGSEAAFATGSFRRSESLRDLWEVNESDGYAPYPEPRRVVVLGRIPVRGPVLLEG
ncbi:hypothetical protein GCM10009687_30100 [Asanoa iriomotensis]|uniref:Knr4/Smi1-like domain-containing protein n=1 Tax=Asanoa iriomotensis TaxID=234613 RepID=A0ABQ4CCV1_9ACTN|nr:hypothetical protein Air01nite_66820 [Asanoa iriomotensis]